jgi:hypothetical protein
MERDGTVPDIPPLSGYPCSRQLPAPYNQINKLTKIASFGIIFVQGWPRNKTKNFPEFSTISNRYRLSAPRPDLNK